MAGGSLTSGSEVFEWSGSVGEQPVRLMGLGEPNRGSYPILPLVTNDNLFFAATTSDVGREWRRYPLDGSSAPVLVADINLGVESGLNSDDAEAIVYDGKAYFSASDDGNSDQLWSMDASSTASPRQVTVSNGDDTLLRKPEQFIGSPEGLYFITNSGNLMLLEPGREPVLQVRLRSPRYLVKVGSTFFYNAYFGPSNFPFSSRSSLEAYTLGNSQKREVIKYANPRSYRITGLYNLNDQLFSVEEDGIRSVRSSGECG